MEGNPVGLRPGIAAAFVGRRTRISVAVRRHGGTHSPLSHGPHSFPPPRFKRGPGRHGPLPASPRAPAHRPDGAEAVGKNQGESALKAASALMLTTAAPATGGFGKGLRRKPPAWSLEEPSRPYRGNGKRCGRAAAIPGS